MIVITVPHAIPSNIREGRSYDLVAEQFANLLKANIPDATIIKSHQNRHDILDDNRYHSNKNSKNYMTIKTSPLWEELRQKVKCNESVIVVDSHSFPKHSFIDTHLNAGKDYDIVILDYKPYQDVTIKLIKHLQTNRVVCKITEGHIGSNSILDVLTLHPCYVPTILLEVNESLDTSKMQIIAKIVSDFLLVYYR